MRYRNFIRLVSVILALSIICMPVCAGVALAAENGEGWALVPPEVSDGEGEYMFKVKATAVYDSVNTYGVSGKKITLNSLPSGTKSIYYCGCLYSTAAEKGNDYSMRFGVCYYDHLEDMFIAVDYNYPTHGVYFGSDETRISLGRLGMTMYSEYYAYITNLHPKPGNDYVYGEMYLVASQIEA